MNNYKNLGLKQLESVTGGKNNKWMSWKCPVGTIGGALSGAALGSGVLSGAGFFVGSVYGAASNC